MRRLLGFLIIVVGLVAVLTYLAVSNYNPDCKSSVCARITYKCEGELRVAMQVRVTNNTPDDKKITYIDTATSPGKESTEKAETIPLAARKLVSFERLPEPDVTRAIRVEADGKLLAEGKIGPTDPC